MPPQRIAGDDVASSIALLLLVVVEYLRIRQFKASHLALDNRPSVLVAYSQDFSFNHELGAST